VTSSDTVGNVDIGAVEVDSSSFATAAAETDETYTAMVSAFDADDDAANPW